MNYLQLIKCLPTIAGHMPQVTSPINSAAGGTVPAAILIISKSIFRRNASMTHLTTHFAKQPAHKLNGGHQLGQWARASFAVLVITLMLLATWPESTHAISC